MKKFDKIIKEEINSYFRHMLREDEEKASKISKQRNKSKDDEEIKGTDQYGDYLDDLSDNGQLNVRKIASRITGISTDTSNKANVNKLNSVQSQLRKEIKREKAPGGGHYSLDKDTASDIAQQLKSM